jgi:hypothetical protein
LFVSRIPPGFQTTNKIDDPYSLCKKFNDFLRLEWKNTQDWVLARFLNSTNLVKYFSRVFLEQKVELLAETPL